MLTLIEPPVKPASLPAVNNRLIKLPIVKSWKKETPNGLPTLHGFPKVQMPEPRHGYIKCKKYDFF